MSGLKFAADLAEFFGFGLAIWNGVKMLFLMSANAGTRLSKKVGRDNESTDGAIEYTNRAIKKNIIRVAIFGAIGLLGMIVLYLTK